MSFITNSRIWSIRYNRFDMDTRTSTLWHHSLFQGLIVDQNCVSTVAGALPKGGTRVYVLRSGSGPGVKSVSQLRNCTSSVMVLGGCMRNITHVLQGLHSLKRRRLMGIIIPDLKLRRSDDRLNFILCIPIQIRWCFLGARRATVASIALG